MRAQLLRLGGRAAILGVPFLLLIGLYVAADPFGIVRYHPRLYSDWALQPNRDFVSTELYLRRPRGAYDSFIFGNSRSLAFLSEDWQRYLPATARPFHFDASGESLFGLWTKVRYIDRRGDTIRNAIFVIDSSVLANVQNDKLHLFVKDYRISGESAVAFHWIAFRAFLSKGYLWRYADYRIFGIIRSSMKETFDDRVFTHLPETNDLQFTSAEIAIAKDSISFYRDSTRFRPHNLAAHDYGAAIGTPQIAMLRDIRRVLDAHHSDYFFILSPLSDHRRMSPSDVAALRLIFGAQRVHDFTGLNALTRDIGHFYEASHFRPPVARAVLSEIYDRRTP